jgi:hypothetical protein
MGVIILIVAGCIGSLFLSAAFVFEYLDHNSGTHILSVVKKLNRKACTNIFNTRARMIKVKRNYSNQYQDMTCRWCHQHEESQLHIITECAEFKEISKNTKYEIYYKEDKRSMKAASEILDRVIHQIKKKNLSDKEQKHAKPKLKTHKPQKTKNNK